MSRLTLQTGIRAFAIFDALVLLALVWLIATSDLLSRVSRGLRRGASGLIPVADRGFDRPRAVLRSAPWPGP